MDTLLKIFIPILLVAGGLLAFAFKCWFYGSDGPLDSVGMSDDYVKNLQKLRDRGKITQEQYEEALAKLNPNGTNKQLRLRNQQKKSAR